MALTDRLKGLRSKAEDAVVERKDQIHDAVQKAGEVADQRTGGKYHEKIEKAGSKALGLVDSLEGEAPTSAPGEPATPTAGEQATPTPPAEPPADPPAGS
jgi:hypothetical protein